MAKIMNIETTYVKTGRPEFDNLIPLVRGFLEKDILDVVIDGEKIRGYRSPDSRAIWIRDYSDMIRAFRYFEKNLTSTIKHFADNQSRSGRIFDYFTTFPEKTPCERENWTKYVRVPVEADVEYRFIKAAFENGFEKFGVDILKQYYDLISKKGETYLWYFPDGRHSSVETGTSPEATPTDGWGSGAMLYAFIEGLAGVKDNLRKLDNIRLAPRWEAAGVKQAEARIEYPASGAYVKYKYLQSYKTVKLEIEGSPEIIDIELFLPENKKAFSVNITGAGIQRTDESKNDDRYFRCKIKKSAPSIEVIVYLSK